MDQLAPKEDPAPSPPRKVPVTGVSARVWPRPAFRAKMHDPLRQRPPRFMYRGFPLFSMTQERGVRQTKRTFSTANTWRLPPPPPVCLFRADAKRLCCETGWPPGRRNNVEAEGSKGRPLVTILIPLIRVLSFFAGGVIICREVLRPPAQQKAGPSPCIPPTSRKRKS